MQRNLRKAEICTRKVFSFKTLAMEEVCQDNTALVAIFSIYHSKNAGKNYVKIINAPH